MLARLGVQTGVDIARLPDAVDFIASKLGRAPQSQIC